MKVIRDIILRRPVIAIIATELQYQLYCEYERETESHKIVVSRNLVNIVYYVVSLSSFFSM